RVAGQLRQGDHPLRTLIGREALLREGDELALDKGRRAGRNDERGHLFAPLLAGHSGDGDLVHRRVRLEHELDLPRIDVEAARDDQLLDPAPDRERAVIPDLADVTGAEETVGRERLFRRFGVAPVAPEHLAALEQHLVLLAELDLDAGKRVADASWLARPLVRVGDHDPALGDAVALHRWLPEQLRAALEERGRQRRRAADEDAHARQVGWMRVEVFAQALVQ